MLSCVFCVQTMQVAKLLHYLSGLSTSTSASPAVAKAESLANTSGITAYFQKLSSPEVSLDRINNLHIVVFLCSDTVGGAMARHSGL